MRPARRRRLRLLKLAASCPACGFPVQESIPLRERTRYADSDPDLPVRFVACDERRCRKVFPITARAYQEAHEKVAAHRG